MKRSDLFVRLCGQALAKRILMGAVERNRLAHAYLFAGPDGTGKSIAAEDLAGHVLGAPAAGHADYHVFSPDRQRFLVEQAREACRQASLHPYGGRRGVFLLKQADLLTGAAAATLLKLLEDPPGQALFILLSANPAGVEGTLRSRCQTIPFLAVPPGELAAWLAAQGISGADELASLSGGNPGTALSMAADSAWRDRRAHAEQLVAELGDGDTEAELRRAAEAAEDEGLLAALAPALRLRVMSGWPVDALDAWFDAEAALAANVTRRLTWEVLLLRLRRVPQVGYH